MRFDTFTVAAAALTFSSVIEAGGYSLDVVKRNAEPTLPSCTNFTPFVYAGCFQDPSVPRALLFSGPSNSNMTVETCVAFCKGNDYKYAGLEYYQECFCGASVNGPQVNESMCNLPCAGDKTETCGGNDYLNIYQDTTFPTVNDSTISDYMPMGCYSEGTTGRSLVYRQSQLSTTNMTVEECLFACKDGGYSFAGVEYGQECYCGVVLGNGTLPLNSSSCNMPCTGNSAENCGGRSTLNLYVAQDLESTQPCNGGQSASSSTVTSTTTSISSSSTAAPSTSTTSSSQPSSASPTPSSAQSSSQSSTSSSSASSSTSTTSSPPPSSSSTSSSTSTTSSPPPSSSSTSSSTSTTSSPPPSSSSTSSSTSTTSSPPPSSSSTSSSTSTTSSPPPSSSSTSSSTSTTSSPPPSSSSTSSSTSTTSSPPPSSSSTSSSTSTTSSPPPSSSSTSSSTSTTSSPPPSSSSTSSSSSSTSSPLPSSSSISTTSPIYSSSSQPQSTTSTSQSSASSTSSTSQSSTISTTSKPVTSSPQTTSSTKTSASLCTSTTTITPTPTCEYQCGSWCSTPIPTFNDYPSCWSAFTSCELQLTSCFLQAGFPSSLNCLKFSSWCNSISSYCGSYCPGNSCNRDNCKSKNPPSGPALPSPTISTSVYTCPPASTSAAKPSTTSAAKPSTTTCVPVPTNSNICTQPSNSYYGYSPSSPVGGIPLPCLTCNNLLSDYNSGNCFKLYTAPDTSSCPSYQRSGSHGPAQGCKDACQNQYNGCMNTYAEGCRGNSRGDTYGSASMKCEAQLNDCYNVNSWVTGSGRCQSWNSGWF